MAPAHFGLYVHVPFCGRKCAYCSFCSIPLSAGRTSDYLEGLTAEVQRLAGDPRLRGRAFTTLYVGGGTPSVLPPLDFRKLWRLITGSFPFSERPEVTVEANPESIGPELLSTLASIRGGRLGLGAQSFCADVLRTLGRGHDPDAVPLALRRAREAGVEEISLDLIFGTPGETLGCWRETLRAAASLGPDHVSCYCLSIESGTPLEAAVKTGELRPLDESAQERMYDAARADLAGEGYRHYEVCNFAKPGCESRHNMGYWVRGEYLGLGASAHSHMGGFRWSNVSDVDEYCSRSNAGKSCVAWSEEINQEQAIDEAVMLSLRTSDGLDLDALQAMGGVEAARILVAAAGPLLEKGVLALRGRKLTIPERYWFVSDEIIARLLEGLRRGDQRMRNTKHLR